MGQSADGCPPTGASLPFCAVGMIPPSKAPSASTRCLLWALRGLDLPITGICGREMLLPGSEPSRSALSHFHLAVFLVVTI